MAGDSGEGEWVSEWLSAVQLTQGLSHSLNQDEDPDLGFSLHQRHGFQYDNSGDYYGYSDSECDSQNDDQSYSSTDSEDSRYARRFRSMEGYPQYRSESREEAKAPSEKLPSWFVNQPFQYSGKVLLISAPGLLLMLALGGDMFITIATLGSLGMYLCHSSGYYGRTLTFYLVTFVCLQLTVIYSVLPLLWKTWWNLVLVAPIVTFSALTGAWLLLAFHSFRSREPQLAVAIETMLFSLYPALGVVLVTFLLATVTSVMTAPYCLLFIGFPILQNFLTPTMSSFKKVETGKPEVCLIMQPSQIAMGVFLYANSAPITFVACALATHQLFSITALVELVFVVCLSVLLAACFDTEQFMQEYGISPKYKRHFLIGCGGVVMVAAPVVLRRHGIHSPLLPWLPLAALLHTVLVYLLHGKHTKRAVYGCCLALLCFYVIIFTQLPWKPEEVAETGSVPVHGLYAALLCDVLLSLLCVFSYVSASEQVFGLTVLAQSIGLVVTFKLFEAAELMNFMLSVGLGALAVYLLLRLYYSDKIPMHHALFAIALHVTAALTNLPQSTAESTTSGSFGIAWAIIEFVLLFMLEVAMCRIMVFQQEINVSSKRDFLKVLCETGVLAVVNAPLWLTRLLTGVTRAEPGLAEYITTILVLEGIVAIKLYVNSDVTWVSARSVGPCLFIAAILVTVVEPQLSVDWENMVKWMLLISLFTCITITRLVTQLRKSLALLVVMATAAGFPLGFSISAMAFPNGFLTVHVVNSILATTLFVVSILVWLESTAMEERVMKSVATLIAMFMVAMLMCVVMEGRVVAMEMTVCSSLFTAALVLSIVLKAHSLRRQSLQFTKEGLIRISKLPLLGNGCTLVAMVTFWLVSPWQLDYSVYLSTCVLVFLQRDHYILKSHSKLNNLTPTIATAHVILTIATCVYSDVWLATEWWPWLLGAAEVYIAIATLPVLHILTTVMWNERFYISDRSVVFLTPLYSVLILVGTSYTSWLLGTVGMTSGWWLMTYKLPLDR